MHRKRGGSRSHAAVPGVLGERAMVAGAGARAVLDGAVAGGGPPRGGIGPGRPGRGGLRRPKRQQRRGHARHSGRAAPG